jgi:hypothetical protein
MFLADRFVRLWQMTTHSLLEMERILKNPVDLELTVNDLRLIVSCFDAVAYLAKIDGECYLDPDGWALKERLEGLYRDELEWSRAFGYTEPGFGSRD